MQLLPQPLLALVASHLPPSALLRLQRCSSNLHHLRADESFMVAAWRWAELSHITSLYEWTPHPDLNIAHLLSIRVHLIPVTVWQAALSRWRDVFAMIEHKAEDLDSDDSRYDSVRQLLQQPQRTHWLVLRTGRDRFEDSSEGSEVSTDILHRVEVLADIGWNDIDHELSTLQELVELRYRLVLQSCPYLQRLHCRIDRYWHKPFFDDTYALMPHLRSLRIEQCPNGNKKDVSHEMLLTFRPLLDRLPHLTSLHCTHLRGVSIDDLLAIAAHSTLEQLYIEVSGRQYLDCQWIGLPYTFPCDERRDELSIGLSFHYFRLSGDIEAEENSTEAGEDEREDERADMERLSAALTRTQPTLRSCEVRLALADWLHRRLRRARLPTDDHQPSPQHSKLRLRRLRRQLRLLRSTLQRQASECVAVTRE